MAQVINPTSFPHALYRKLGPGDQEYDVVVVRATYRFTEDNWPLFESSHQQPIRWQPTLEGDSDNLYAQVISDDRDVLLGKLSTEVHVQGTLRSPTGQPRSTWQVRVQVGPVDKRLIVRGPREFRWQLLGGWRVTDPTPVSEVLLDYRYAFGGHYRLPDEDALANTLYYPDNPAGRGWLPSRADYKRVSSEVARYLKPDLNAVTRLPAPQLEDPGWLVTSPFDRPAPAGFGPIAPWWEPRVSYQGTEDNAGSGVGSGTSQGSGYVLFMTGHDNVKANGQPVVRAGSESMINCNAAGVGGAKGYVHTNTESVNSQPEESSEPLSEAERFQQEAQANLERLGELQEALNNNPNGKTNAEAEALYAEVKHLISETQAQREALVKADQAGYFSRDELEESDFWVGQAASRARNMEQEAERQVQYTSDTGRTLRQVGDFAGEMLVTPYGLAKDAWEFGKQVVNGHYMAATGVALVALVSVIPGVRWFRRSKSVDDMPGNGGGNRSETPGDNDGLWVEQPYRSANFADETKLQQHFEKHGAEFGARSADEYLSMARGIMQSGDRVQYMYNGELRTGFFQFMGNNRRGQSKFAFVGTNKQGQITTLHAKSGKDFWKTLNGSAHDRTIYPVEWL